VGVCDAARRSASQMLAPSISGTPNLSMLRRRARCRPVRINLSHDLFRYRDRFRNARLDRRARPRSELREPSRGQYRGRIQDHAFPPFVHRRMIPSSPSLRLTVNSRHGWLIGFPNYRHRRRVVERNGYLRPFPNVIHQGRPETHDAHSDFMPNAGINDTSRPCLKKFSRQTL
jgi:hypothetical protein